LKNLGFARSIRPARWTTVRRTKDWPWTQKLVIQHLVNNAKFAPMPSASGEHADGGEAGFFQQFGGGVAKGRSWSVSVVKQAKLQIP